MTFNKRRSEILNKIIKEYIVQAEPISSDYLKRKCHIDLSSATIRSEMLKLTEQGYLYQPHTSAGRVPTDKGYRYFVDLLLEKEINSIINEKIRNEIVNIKKEITDYLTYIQAINRFISSLSSGFALSYLVQEKICLREGLGKIFENPEFSDVKYTKNFLSMIDSFQDNFQEFEVNDFSINVFIGNEIPARKSNDFSVVVSKVNFFENKETVIAILGPKRMAYNKNISLINSIIKSLKETQGLN
jgi:transcriptional regulator of heat shock response